MLAGSPALLSIEKADWPDGVRTQPALGSALGANQIHGRGRRLHAEIDRRHEDFESHHREDHDEAGLTQRRNTFNGILRMQN